MQKSIFKKYFVSFIAVILITLFSLGVVLLLVSSSKIKKIKEDEMEKSFEDVLVSVNEYFANSSFTLSRLEDSMKVSSNKIRGHIYFCNSLGTVIATSNIELDASQRKFSYRVTDNVTKTPQYTYGTFDGIYGEEQLVLQSEYKNTLGLYYIFVTSPEAEKAFFNNEVFSTYVKASIIIAGVIIIFMGIVLKSALDPLISICAATKKYAKGDFSQKILIRNNRDEISELSGALNEMAESLSRTENTRKSFVANVSHELRTPMTSISGFIDGILDGTIPECERNNYLKIVGDETKRLSRLVGSMLNMAKLESGEMRLNYRKFDIVGMAIKCVLTFEKNINKKQIDVRGLDTKKIMVYADEDLIHQVLYNLVENAIKFCDEGGYIGFTYELNNDEFKLAVMNSGEGLEETEIPLVFERFYKSDTSRGIDKAGLGLGLYISSSIINLHQGEMSVSSKKDQYTEFSFTLPLTKNNYLRGRRIE